MNILNHIRLRLEEKHTVVWLRCVVCVIMYLSVVLFVDGEDIICIIYRFLYYLCYLCGNFETVCRSHLCAGLSHLFYFHVWPSDRTIIQCAFRFLQFSAVCMLILSAELVLWCSNLKMLSPLVDCVFVHLFCCCFVTKLQKEPHSGELLCPLILLNS